MLRLILNNIKYIAFILAFIVLAKKANSQTDLISNENFFGISADSTFGHQKEYEKVSVNNRIIAFRKFHDNQFVIKQEYIRYKKNTFLYNEYTELDHKLISSGLVVPVSHHTDTFEVEVIDPETFETKIKIVKKFNWDWSKEGSWKIRIADSYEYGNYKNNLKVGSWYVGDKESAITKKVNPKTMFISNKNFFNLPEDYDFKSQKQYEKISVGNQIIAFRKFHDNQFTIAQEYIRYKNDTFLFNEYTQLDHQITSGLVVPISSYGHLKWDWSKEGAWEVRTADTYEHGNYKNNLKVGEWYIWNKKTESAKYIFFDNAGNQLGEEPCNLIETNNKERIINELLGSWMESLTSDNKGLLFYRGLVRVHRSEGFFFDKNNVVKYILNRRSGTGFDFDDFKKRSTGNWTIDDDNVLLINVYKIKNKKYKIIYLSRYKMILDPIE
jgi:hypothetical protein